ncbi:hypothetical protein C9374_010497 [Naegleria lovaniensis]|uniref:Carbonic anhydrase n=1 Tax=Naegleria lovaniensis TaxID=51637 RepID=A0AA88GGH8_NAELO|nr:uncharacterized protein C9374_010497 [Naegleria lovaniensis]KAG2374753.1 hypothetical protein C9374_010497 [Naegleria lovaniensis]
MELESLSSGNASCSKKRVRKSLLSPFGLDTKNNRVVSVEFSVSLIFREEDSIGVSFQLPKAFQANKRANQTFMKNLKSRSSSSFITLRTLLNNSSQGTTLFGNSFLLPTYLNHLNLNCSREYSLGIAESSSPPIVESSTRRHFKYQNVLGKRFFQQKQTHTLIQLDSHIKRFARRSLKMQPQHQQQQDENHSCCDHQHHGHSMNPNITICPGSIDFSTLSIDHQPQTTPGNSFKGEEPSEHNLSRSIEGLLHKFQLNKGINAPGRLSRSRSTEEFLTSYDKLLQGNKNFVLEKTSKDPEFFSRLKEVQRPDYMLIGCSDSRVPPDQLTQTQPGQIFIHRNVANMVVNTDLNVMSVLQYAVEVLKVKHVIVMGHTRCGGVMAALTNKQFGLIDNWLRNIKDVYRLHKAEIDAIQDQDQKINRMIELNVIEQTLNLCKTSIVQTAWAKGNTLHVHGWVCDIETGLIKDLEIEETRWKEIEDIYKIDFGL